jgi:hypothetical protein
MSNLFSSVTNYSGRQPGNTQDVKQFVTSVDSLANWIYKRINPTSYSTIITTANQTKDVYIPKNLYVNGSIFNPSDEKLKTNIKYLNECDHTNNLIINLNPISFEYHSDNLKQTHYGFIAQDIEKQFPTLVSSDTMGYKTVNYIEIIPLMLAKLQKMQEEIDELKQRLK